MVFRQLWGHELGPDAVEIQKQTNQLTAEEEERIAWLSRKTLCRECRIGKNNIDRVIASLEKKGWLKVIRRGSKGITNRYVLFYPIPKEGYKGKQMKVYQIRETNKGSAQGWTRVDAAKGNGKINWNHLRPNQEFMKAWKFFCKHRGFDPEKNGELYHGIAGKTTQALNAGLSIQEAIESLEAVEDYPMMFNELCDLHLKDSPPKLKCKIKEKRWNKHSVVEGIF